MSAGGTVETELKLRVSDKALQRVNAHPLFRRGERTPARKLKAVYYDTPELDLWRKGAALRVRREGARWVQTVKWSGAVNGGLHQRNELEAEVQGPAPDLAKIEHPELDALFRSPQITGSLQPVFETTVTRSTRLLELHDDVFVEVSIDRGEIRSGERAEEVKELELELKRGSTAALYELAMNIADKEPVALENRSKAERGYALYREHVPTPVKATTPALDPRMSVSDAFACIASTTLRQLQANERGALTEEDPEFLHQMRVALRRLRSALSAFSPVLPQASRDPIVKELKWIGAALGAARDWDVLLTETLPPIRQTHAENAALETVTQACRRLQLAAQRDMRRAVRSRRYQRAMLATGSWLASKSWREGADEETLAALDAPVREYAQRELERRYERARKLGRKLDDRSPEELHRLRISVKKLRYSVDFFASLFDAEAMRAVKPRLSRLQDVLGSLNDAATLRRLLGDVLADTQTPVIAEARGVVLGWGAGRADALRRDLGRSWKAFRRSGTFW